MLEKITYILLSLTCCVALFAIVDRALVRPAGSGPAEHRLLDRSVKLSGVTYGRRNVVLAVSTNCHFCRDSSRFYAALSRVRSARFSFKLIVVAQEPVPEVRAYLANEHVEADAVVSGSFSDIGVSGTPTLLLVDRSGVVKSAFVGKLSAARERTVLEAVERI